MNPCLHKSSARRMCLGKVSLPFDSSLLTYMRCCYGSIDHQLYNFKVSPMAWFWYIVVPIAFDKHIIYRTYMFHPGALNLSYSLPPGSGQLFFCRGAQIWNNHEQNTWGITILGSHGSSSQLVNNSMMAWYGWFRVDSFSAQTSFMVAFSWSPNKQRLSLRWFITLCPICHFVGDNLWFGVLDSPFFWHPMALFSSILSSIVSFLFTCMPHWGSKGQNSHFPKGQSQLELSRSIETWDCEQLWNMWLIEDLQKRWLQMHWQKFLVSPCILGMFLQCLSVRII